MSANVWFEEVERGLKEEILRTVEYLTPAGVKEPVSNEMVFVRDPEEDLREEEIPCVTITPIMNRFDPKRYNPNPVVISRDTKNNIAHVQESAVSFNLVYQIDFWSRYREDMNIMTSSWIKKHFRQFNLPVVDDGGVVRSSNVLIYESMKPVDLMKNQKRLYHSIISYVIWVELDDEVGYNVPMVAERIVKAESSGSTEDEPAVNEFRDYPNLFCKDEDSFGALKETVNEGVTLSSDSENQEVMFTNVQGCTLNQTSMGEIECYDKVTQNGVTTTKYPTVYGYIEA